MRGAWSHCALFERGRATGVRPDHARRLRIQFAALDSAQVIDDVDLPDFRLHLPKDGMAGRWSITVSGRWGMTFESRDGNVYVLDYEDYHGWMTGPRCTIRLTRGEFISELYLLPFGVSGRELAKRLDVSASTLSRVLSGASRVTPEMALQLSRRSGAPRRAGSRCRT